MFAWIVPRVTAGLAETLRPVQILRAKVDGVHGGVGVFACVYVEFCVGSQLTRVHDGTYAAKLLFLQELINRVEIEQRFVVCLL